METQATPEAKPQAPAQATSPTEVQTETPKPAPSGISDLTVEQLKELYKKSPEMFTEAGIAKKEEKAVPVQEPPKPQGAAPLKFGESELKLPEDVPVNRAAVEEYLAHAKEIGLSAAQVQREIDFNIKKYREMTAQQKPPTPQEQDAANVAALKQEFGAEYDKNIEIARKAAAKFGDPDLLALLKTSNPVLVKHFLKLGKADAEDTTPARGEARTGIEEEVNDQETNLRARYPNSPSMFKPKG